MTVAHLRTYTINQGQMESWLKIFDETVIPLLDEAGIKVESTWVNEEETQFVWIRSYGDSVSDIEAKEAAFYGSPGWTANVDKIRGHLAHRDIKLIRSA